MSLRRHVGVPDTHVGVPCVVGAGARPASLYRRRTHTGSLRGTMIFGSRLPRLPVDPSTGVEGLPSGVGGPAEWLGRGVGRGKD